MIDQGVIVAVTGLVGALAAYWARVSSQAAKQSKTLFDGYSKLSKDQQDYFDKRKAEWEDDRRAMQKEWDEERGKLMGQIEHLEKSNEGLKKQLDELSRSVHKHGIAIDKTLKAVKNGNGNGHTHKPDR